MGCKSSRSPPVAPAPASSKNPTQGSPKSDPASFADIAAESGGAPGRPPQPEEAPAAEAPSHQPSLEVPAPAEDGPPSRGPSGQLLPLLTSERSGRSADGIQKEAGKPGKPGRGAIGNPFPKRPLMCKLSATTWNKLEEMFHRMDPDGSNAVTREEAGEFFKGAFKNISADAMFNEVDVDKSGAISSEEFVQFWIQVRSAGYSDQDIADELDELMDGGSWVDWKDGRDTSHSQVKFPKRPIFCKLSGKCWAKCEELFKAMDSDHALNITREKAAKYFHGGFSKMSVEAMFHEVDLNNHGAITAADFMKFWVQVKGSGYKEKDIIEEITNMLEDGENRTWVDWKDGRCTA